MNLTLKICKEMLKKRNVEANVTGRVKSKDSLMKKLYCWHSTSNFSNRQAILNNRLDFVGLRISLYFPDEKAKVIEMIEETFRDVIEAIFKDGKMTGKKLPVT